MNIASITFPANYVSKFEKGGKLYVEMQLSEYDKEDIRLSAYDDHFEIFAYHTDNKTSRKPGDHNHSFWHKRHSLRRRIEVPAYALISQARANFQNGKLVIDIPLKGVKL